MNYSTTVVGLDVHKKTIVASVLPAGSDVVTERMTIENNPAARAAEVDARIAHRKTAVYDVDAIQGTLQRFASFIYKMPLELQVWTLNLLVKQVTLFKNRVRVEFHELPISDLQGALDAKIAERDISEFQSRRALRRWEQNTTAASGPCSKNSRRSRRGIRT